jgi:hypothetical protein
MLRIQHRHALDLDQCLYVVSAHEQPKNPVYDWCGMRVIPGAQLFDDSGWDLVSKMYAHCCTTTECTVVSLILVVLIVVVVVNLRVITAVAVQSFSRTCSRLCWTTH